MSARIRVSRFYDLEKPTIAGNRDEIAYNIYYDLILRTRILESRCTIGCTRDHKSNPPRVFPLSPPGKLARSRVIAGVLPPKGWSS